MNHFAVRSAAALLLKRDLRLPNRAHKPVDLTYWVERNFNTVEDLSVSAMAPATEALYIGYNENKLRNAIELI